MIHEDSFPPPRDGPMVPLPLRDIEISWVRKSVWPGPQSTAETWSISMLDLRCADVLRVVERGAAQRLDSRLQCDASIAVRVRRRCHHRKRSDAGLHDEQGQFLVMILIFFFF